ncbi:YebC-like protein [Mollisia scopiformis]|uniref:YebC-like protein n=1 Tax=Mollisia scopiformis TaxID=149040 RepID=A0A194XJU9_MOLSC|nr:YebC-like protein [Mollisia scopiformis]KUJ20062.1 YebC-like protein [Mollisia scopiformis]
MAAFSRGLRSLGLRSESICPRCLQFSTSATAQSGHNRWSKIKHDKGNADAKKNAERSLFARDIALASKLYGGDPNTNPRLATILQTAKKAGFPKASMEAAIARGQGKSATGAALENVTLEVITPSTVAMIIEMETDNRNRTLSDVRNLVKIHGGNVTPTNYLFQKKGRIAFEKHEGNIGVDEILDEAIEAGAEDVETDDDGSIVLWTEPSKTMAAAEALQKSHGLKVESADIIWDANEDTRVSIDSEDVVKALTEFAEALQDYPNVQGVYTNVVKGVNISEGIWEGLLENLDA